jgi:hypothetical protein
LLGFGNREVFDYQIGESVFCLAEMNETEMTTLRLAGDHCNLELLQDVLLGQEPILEEPQYRKRAFTDGPSNYSIKRNKY